MTDRRRDGRPDEWLQALAQLGDLARVRLLWLVELAELGVGVGELATAAQLPQSTVSRHLKALQEHGWIVKRLEGTSSYYRLRQELDPDLRRLWETTRDRVAEGPAFADDEARLTEVLSNRRTDSQAFFGRIGGEWHELRRELFGTGFGAEAMLGLLDPDCVIGDLGCGTGDVTERLWFARSSRSIGSRRCCRHSNAASAIARTCGSSRATSTRCRFPMPRSMPPSSCS